MKENLEKITKIMKLYYDKKEENGRLFQEDAIKADELRQKVKKLAEAREKRIQSLQFKISTLDESMKKEISEYVTSYNENYNISFPTTNKKMQTERKKNENMLSKSIEERYNNLRDKMNEEIQNLSQETEEEKEAIEFINSIPEQPKFANVYFKELVEIANFVREQLNSEKESIKNELNAIKQQKISASISNQQIKVDLGKIRLQYDGVLKKISDFEFKYDKDGNTINDQENNDLKAKLGDLSEQIKVMANPKRLLDTSNLDVRINDLNEVLMQIEWNLHEIESENLPTFVELEPWEQEEYNIRKSAEIKEDQQRIKQILGEDYYNKLLGKGNLEDVVEEQNDEISQDETVPVQETFEEQNDEISQDETVPVQVTFDEQNNENSQDQVIPVQDEPTTFYSEYDNDDQENSYDADSILTENSSQKEEAEINFAIDDDEKILESIDIDSEMSELLNKIRGEENDSSDNINKLSRMFGCSDDDDTKEYKPRTKQNDNETKSETKQNLNKLRNLKNFFFGSSEEEEIIGRSIKL